MECPKCRFVCDTASPECPRCGLVFAKVRRSRASSGEDHAATPRQERDASRSLRYPNRESHEYHDDARDFAKAESGEHLEEHSPTGHIHGRVQHFQRRFVYEPTIDAEEECSPEPRHMDRNDWLVLVSGPVFAAIIMCIPLLNHIFMTFVTLVHEMGHTLVGWIFGYPALPAFDLQYGGGVTATMPRSALLLVVFYAVMAFLVYTYRKNRTTLVCLVVCVALHILLSITTLHNVVFLMMGHGMELVIAGIFLYRALSGAAVVHAAERPLYSIISWFIVLSDFRFAYRLATSAHMRRMYEEAKGGGHWMDFSRVAEDHLHTDLTVIAMFFFIATFLPLVIGYLAFRYQEYLRCLVLRMWAREPS